MGKALESMGQQRHAVSSCSFLASHKVGCGQNSTGAISLSSLECYSERTRDCARINAYGLWKPLVYRILGGDVVKLQAINRRIVAYWRCWVTTWMRWPAGPSLVVWKIPSPAKTVQICSNKYSLKGPMDMHSSGLSEWNQSKLELACDTRT